MGNHIAVVRRHAAHRGLPVSFRVIDDGAVHGPHRQLGLPVPVPVVGDDVQFHLPAADHVRPHVDGPQLGAVQLVSLYKGVRAVVVHLEQPFVVVKPLHDKLVFPVAVQVRRRGIVQAIVLRDVRPPAGIDLPHRDFQILPVPHLGRFASLLLLAPHHGPHRVGGRLRTRRIREVGNLQRLLVHPRAVAVKVILSVIVLRTVDTPTRENA